MKNPKKSVDIIYDDDDVDFFVTQKCGKREKFMKVNKDTLPNVLVIYPEDLEIEEQISYRGMTNEEVRASIIKEMQDDLNIDGARVENIINVFVAGAVDRHRLNAKFNLAKVIQAIGKITPERLHGIILVHRWNKPEFFYDFGQFGARDLKSKLAIIKDIIENYPELEKRFISLGIFKHRELEPYASQPGVFTKGSGTFREVYEQCIYNRKEMEKKIGDKGIESQSGEK